MRKWIRMHNAVVKKRELLTKKRRKARSKEAEVILPTMVKEIIEKKYSSRIWKAKQRRKLKVAGGAGAMCTVS